MLQLPALNQLDALQSGADFTAVGYGLQRNLIKMPQDVPAPDDKSVLADRVRMYAKPQLVQVSEDR